MGASSAVDSSWRRATAGCCCCCCWLLSPLLTPALLLALAATATVGGRRPAEWARQEQRWETGAEVAAVLQAVPVGHPRHLARTSIILNGTWMGERGGASPPARRVVGRSHDRVQCVDGKINFLQLRV